MSSARYAPGALTLVASVAALQACGDIDATRPDRCEAPGVLSSEVTRNPRNVLAAAVNILAPGADSLAVGYRAAGERTAWVTPAVVPQGETASVPVLGLLPDTEFRLWAVSFGACGDPSIGPALSVRTGELPADLPRFSAAGPNPSPGFVAFAAGRYGVVIDNSGRVVWYHPFDLDPGFNFQPQPNGRYVARPPSAHPAAPWIEIDPEGRTTRMLHCTNGLTTRFHDMLALPDGSFWLLCDERRTLDLSHLGGGSDVQVVGTTVQHIGAHGELLFQWSTFDHIPIVELSDSDRASALINWTHGNALEIDHDGNLLLSFRNLGEVVKVAVPSGWVLWRLGGPRSDFDFEGGSRAPFRHQHGVRVVGSGQLLLLDNLGEPDGSRAELYALDDAERRLRLIAAYASIPTVIARVGGTTQSLPGGHTLVSFGSGGRVEEYDADGNVAWKIEGSTGYVFRAQRILSLYLPGVGLPR